jgi:hypothetical protein
MTDFSRLDRADDWLAAVTGSIRRRVMSAGPGDWSRSPEFARSRQRANSLMQRAAVRVGREVRHLADTRQVPDERVSLARLRDRSEDRTARALARYQRPASRAAR